MEFDNILNLIKAVSNSSLTSITIEDEDFKISMKTDKGNKIVTTASQAGNVVYSSADNQGLQEVGAPRMQSASSTTGTDDISDKFQGNTISSPLVGTFYNSQSPEHAPFVSIGDKVIKGQTLGIIEAMKLMNEIECEYDGTVEAILVENEQIVEYGQPLFVIK